MDIVIAAREALENKKAIDLLSLDLRNHSDITDFVMIASGSSPPHLRAMAEEVRLRLKERGVNCYRKSGTPEAGWILLDYVDVVIHLFEPNRRAFYDLESLWANAPRDPT